VTLDLEHEDIDAELVVDARSRTPAIELLRLSQAGITTDDSGWIEVDQQQRTSEPRIFAVGDVTGPPLLAGVALAQGRIAAEAICNIASAWDPAAVPHLVYSNPNVAFCGELVATDDSAITTIPWAFSGRAVGINAANGITMLHWHQESGLVLGVGICGADACELIETAVLAIEMGATLEDLAAIVPAHPTRSELLGQVARAALMDQASR
jgi:dihydrolipoamide dehydrogenase